MAIALDSLQTLRAAPFDQIIDVRSPSEFAEDHIPGAVNLPVLDDAERAEVGTIYVQDCKFKARKIGAAYVARNAARHLQSALAEKEGGWRPLVYCWRGGQRSGSFASILGQIGWRVDTIDGGYKSYRKLVVDALYEAPWPSTIVLLDGDTGVGKTALLKRLADQGAQVLDLEGLAGHRGSLFGAVAGGQPSQKTFEGALAAARAALDPTRPVVVEAESNAIGALNVPPQLWRAMSAAPRVRMSAPIDARARRILLDYEDLTRDVASTLALIDRLLPIHGHERVAAWRGMAQAGDFEALAADLMRRHYDPRYAKQRREKGGAPSLEVASADLSEASLDAAAATIAASLDEIGATPPR